MTGAAVAMPTAALAFGGLRSAKECFWSRITYHVEMSKWTPMERVSELVTPEEADRRDRAYYASLTPQERLEIQALLIEQYYGFASRLERVLTVAELPRR
jgi:hypothetical protein